MNENGELRVVHRTCRMPLRIPTRDEWVELRRISHLCAKFGNHLLTEFYAKTRGLSGLHPYTDYRAMLSSAVRDAVSRQCIGIWRRLGKRILRGEQTLARFSANRALIVRGQGVLLERLPDNGLVLRVRLRPAQAGPPTRFPVWMPALERDRWLSEVVEKIQFGSYRLTRLALVFERPGRKVLAFVSYSKSIKAPVPGDGEAILECSNQSCRLRSGDHTLSLNDAVYRLAAMKAHFAGIQTRLRNHLGKPGRRRALRTALLKAGSFEQWAQGPLHQLSRQMVDWCREHEVAVLRWNVEQTPAELPWTRLEAFIKCKADEVGIQVLKVARNQPVGPDEGSNSEATPPLDAAK